MTTERDLIQRLADALTNAIRVIHNEDGTQHISTATPVLSEAYAFLSQPEPQGLTDEEILNLSEEHCVSYTRLDGSVTYPYENDMNMKDDVLFFARSLIAADRARWGRPAIQPEPEETTDSESTKDKINNSLMKFNYEKTSNHSDN